MVAEVAVVGVDDIDFGQRIAAVVKVHEGGASALPMLADLKQWSRERAASYKAPSELWLVDTIPRNAMGKVNKTKLLQTLEATGHTPTRFVAS